MADPQSGWRRSIRLTHTDDDGDSTVALLEDREIGREEGTLVATKRHQFLDVAHTAVTTTTTTATAA